MNTPWGQSDGSKEYGSGIVFYSTSSHGGFHVTATLLAKMPDYMRDSFSGEGEWFEEDCAWSMVTTCFPERFSESEQKAAKETLRSTFPEMYAKFYGAL
jgi:hypothetical protein